MKPILATFASLVLGAATALACPPVPVVPGAGLLQQQSFMQSYSSFGATPVPAPVPTPGCGYGSVGASFAPSFAPSYAPTFGPVFVPVRYGTAGGVPVPPAGHGHFHVRGRF